MNIKKLFWWWQSGVSEQYDLLRFSVKYRTSDFAYLTTTTYSDFGTVPSPSRLINVITVESDETYFPTGTQYVHSIDGKSDYLAWRNTKLGGSHPIKKWNYGSDTLTYDSDINPSGGAFEQGPCIDYKNNLIYSYTYSAGASTVDIFNISGVYQSTIDAPDVPGGAGSDIHWCYDHVNDRFLVSKQGTEAVLQIWKIVSGEMVLIESKWYKAGGGVAYDPVGDRFVMCISTQSTIPNTTSSFIRFSNEDGYSDNFIPKDTTFGANITEEGIIVFPDGTVGIVTPNGWETPIAEGNRFWWRDPYNVYKKYDRSPSMSRFSEFWSGGELSGEYYNEKITQRVGNKIYSPIYDTNGFTNTENSNAWEFEFSDGGDADITWICSDTAPTTTPYTHGLSDIPTYSGWGSTTPDAESETPTTKRYKQAVLTVKNADVSTLITVQDLIDSLNPTILCLPYDTQYMHIYPDSNPANAAHLMINLADGENSFVNTANTAPVNGTNELDIQSGDNTSLQTPSSISSDTQGTWVFVMSKSAANSHFQTIKMGESGSFNNAITLRHNRSSGGTGTPANGVTISEHDSAGTIINQVYFTDANVAHARYDFESNGSTWVIKKGGVSQSLTVSVGSNTGNWFGDKGGTKNQVLANNIGKFRMLIYVPSVLTTAQSDLIDDFITQEGLV